MEKEYYNRLLKLREEVIKDYNKYKESEEYKRQIALNLPIHYTKELNTSLYIYIK